MAPDDDGVPPGVRVNDVPDAPQALPMLARDEATGWLVAAWLDSRDRLTRDVYASVSRDGATWSPSRRVNANGRPELAERPLIAPRRAGGVWLLWSQTHGETMRTWVRRVTPGERRGGAAAEEEPIVASLPGPVIEPLPPRRLVLEERFDGASIGNMAPLAGSWIVNEGALLSFGNAPVFASWKTKPLADFVLEGRFRLDRREHLGARLFFRTRPVAGRPGALEGYELRNHFRMGVLLSRTRVTLGEDHAPAFATEPLADRWFPLRQDTWYEFRVVAVDGRLDYWLNGEWMLSHEGLEPREGEIVLGADARAPVEWDDLALYSLAASR
jgi:hypothetical protein